jgi:energy-coupling factor transporter ATP-binding protein EcfA2
MLNTQTVHIHTRGGAPVIGDVHAGTFVGRDQYIGYSYEQVVALVDEIRRADRPKTWDGRIPYIGLVPFQEEDSALFAGREELVHDLIKRLHTSRFLCVAGPSGSGKSSLVRAGLIVALKRGEIPGSDKWLFETLTPRSNPIEQLARAMSAMASRLGMASAEGDVIRTVGMTDPDALSKLAELLARGPRDQRVALVVDQFEELFTLTRQDAERTAFLNLLTSAAQRADGRVTVIVALRSDFVSQCAQHSDLRQLMNRQFQLVGAMEPQELARAIAFPALEVGAQIDPNLVDRIIADMKGEPGMLPLMQFALRDLFESKLRQPGQIVQLTLTDYVERGGIQQALARHANAAFDTLSPDQRVIARHVFSRLVEPGDSQRNIADTRRIATTEELVEPDTDRDAVEDVIDSLAAARLITIDERDERGAHDKTITLAHEQLIDAWPWLHRLVDENREAIVFRNQIGDDAREWDEKGRDPAFVYVGSRLELVRERLSAAGLSVTGLAQDFLNASLREDHSRERARYLGQTAGIALGAGLGFGCAIALTVALAGLPTYQDPGFLSRYVSVQFTLMIPGGAIVGSVIGLALWRWRQHRTRRIIMTVIAGMLAGMLAFLLYALAIYKPTIVSEFAFFASHAVGGSLLGAALGLGVGLAANARQRLTLIPLLGAVGMALAGFIVPLTATNSLAADVTMLIIAGVVLGALTGLGYQATAVKGSVEAR